MDLTTQSINDSQDIFKSQCGLACFKVDHEPYTNPCSKGQLGLSQSQSLSCFTQGKSELFRGSNGCHCLIGFPIRKFSAQT